jgi:hypothetical protein
MLSHPRGLPQLTALVGQNLEHYLNFVGVVYQLTIPCKSLQGVARFSKHLHPAAPQSSQFPSVLTDGIGSSHKPAAW